MFFGSLAFNLQIHNIKLSVCFAENRHRFSLYHYLNVYLYPQNYYDCVLNHQIFSGKFINLAQIKYDFHSIKFFLSVFFFVRLFQFYSRILHRSVISTVLFMKSNLNLIIINLYDYIRILPY